MHLQNYRLLYLINLMKNKQFYINLVSNLVNYGFTLLIGVFFTPYLVNHLGKSSFGIVTLAQTLASYLAIFTLVISSGINRFLVIALKSSDIEESNQIFNTTLLGILLLVTALIIPCWLFSINIQHIIAIPEGLEYETVILIGLMFVFFMISNIAMPFSVSTFVKNRLDLKCLVEVSGNMGRIGIIVLLFTLYTPRLWHVGCGLILSSLILLGGSIYNWRSLLPEISIKPKCFQLKTLQKLVSFGFWIAVDQVGILLYIGIDLLVANKVLGTELAGDYSITLQWANMLRGISTAIGYTFTPAIFILYAAKDFKGLYQQACSSIKFTGYLLSLPAAYICGLAPLILKTWIGPSYTHLSTLMILLTAHLALCLSSMPLFQINVANNKVKPTAIFTLFIGLTNLIMAVIFAKIWGVYGIAVSGIISLTIKNVLFTPLYIAHHMKYKASGFYREYLQVGILFVVLAVTLYEVRIWWLVPGWSGLIIYGLLLTILWGIVGWLWVIDKPTKDKIIAKIPLFQRS